MAPTHARVRVHRRAAIAPDRAPSGYPGRVCSQRASDSQLLRPIAQEHPRSCHSISASATRRRTRFALRRINQGTRPHFVIEQPDGCRVLLRGRPRGSGVNLPQVVPVVNCSRPKCGLQFDQTLGEAPNAESSHGPRPAPSPGRGSPISGSAAHVNRLCCLVNCATSRSPTTVRLTLQPSLRGQVGRRVEPRPGLIALSLWAGCAVARAAHGSTVRDGSGEHSW